MTMLDGSRLLDLLNLLITSVENSTRHLGLWTRERAKRETWPGRPPAPLFEVQFPSSPGCARRDRHLALSPFIKLEPD